MDEYFPQAAETEPQPALSLRETEDYWQNALNDSVSKNITNTIREARNAVNARLFEQTGLRLDEPVYCTGPGYYQPTANADTMQATGPEAVRVYYGRSQGANVLQVTDQETQLLRFQLTHTVLLPGAQRPIFHMPIQSEQFVRLSELKNIFESPQPNVNRPKEDVQYIAQQYSAGSRRGRFDYMSYERRSELVEEISARVAAKIGTKGCQLYARSQFAYVLDYLKNGKTQLSVDDSLKQPQQALFMGVGCFDQFRYLPEAPNIRDFDYDLHNGLFVAVALGVRATEAAGLLKQSILIPLVGNKYQLKNV